jgi:hypothetical protein
MSVTVAESLVSGAEEAMGPLQAPSQLQDRIDEHRQHVLSLAATVLVSGRDVTFVRRLVDGVLLSYREELVKAIMALREDGSAA